MNILHVIETLDPSGGGVPSAVRSLVAEQERQGHNVSIVSCRVKVFANDSNGKSAANNFNLAEFASTSPFKFVMPSATWRKVFTTLKPDICHLHGIWTPTFVFASKVLRELGIPNIVSPYGQLMPSLLQADNFLKKIKKLIYWRLFARGIVEKAKLIHAVCQAEADILARVVDNAKIQIIYNFVDDVFFNCDSDVNYKTSISSELKIITFMGRVERRKGIANLVEAFCTSTLTAEWQLRIIGPIYEKDLVEWITSRAKSAGVGNKIIIMGPIYGQNRLKAYLDSFAICLPSFSEAVGLVNIEAALLGRLVITTPYAGIREIEDFGGIVCDNDIQTLRVVLNDLQNLPESEYLQRCESLRKWARQTFARETLSKKWEEAVTSVKRNK
ncbi:MAG: glycosyltransferase [Bdellovibrionales bacterium]